MAPFKKKKNIDRRLLQFIAVSNSSHRTFLLSGIQSLRPPDFSSAVQARSYDVNLTEVWYHQAPPTRSKFIELECVINLFP